MSLFQDWLDGVESQYPTVTEGETQRTRLVTYEGGVAVVSEMLWHRHGSGWSRVGPTIVIDRVDSPEPVVSLPVPSWATAYHDVDCWGGAPYSRQLFQSEAREAARAFAAELLPITQDG